MVIDRLKSYFESLNYTVLLYWGSSTDPDKLKKYVFEQEKKYIVFFHNDYELNLNLPLNVLVFRASFKKSKQKK